MRGVGCSGGVRFWGGMGVRWGAGARGWCESGIGGRCVVGCRLGARGRMRLECRGFRGFRGGVWGVRGRSPQAIKMAAEAVLPASTMIIKCKLWQ